ncbi:MAG: glycosyltransferase family 4 protein [candidate division Zixibacteria bacterium]|nr:glycosyltransferase family 4 protein [candidate division Zixibacteria bacterium]
MKILFITSQFPFPPDSGWNIRVFNFIRFLSERHRITLLSFYTEKDNPANFSELTKYCSEIYPLKRSSSYNPLDLVKGMFTRIPFSIWNYRSRKMEKKAKELFSLKEFDVIQVEDIHMSQYLPQDCSGLKILDMHNVESEYLERFSEIERDVFKKYYASLTAKKLKSYEVSNSRKFDICLTVSEKDLKTFQLFAKPKSMELIPNGVDLSCFSPAGVEADPSTLLFLGKLDYRPNVDALVYFMEKIWPRLIEKIPEAKFVVVGKDLPENLRNSLKSRNVILKGYVEDIRKVLSGCAVMVVPLRYGGGTRIKILEAFAMEKAVVSTSLGCEGIEVHSGEEILIADTPEFFADSVVEVLTDSNLRDKLGKNGRKLAQEKYNWEKISQKLEGIYLRAIKQ